GKIGAGHVPVLDVLCVPLEIRNGVRFLTELLRVPVGNRELVPIMRVVGVDLDTVLERNDSPSPAVELFVDHAECDPTIERLRLHLDGVLEGCSSIERPTQADAECL